MIFIRLLLFLSLAYSITIQNFEIQFLGIPAAKVILTTESIVFNNQPATSITFSTNAINLTKYIFNIDNNYNTITSNNMKNIFSFKKYTYQPNVINNIQTSIIANKVIYNNSSIEIPQDTFNIFSLLCFISRNKLQELEKFNIEREGLKYKGTIIPVDISDEKNTITYKLYLEENYNAGDHPLIKYTDIFTWALFKKESEKYITINYNNNEIVECIFQSGLIKMYAKNINYIN